ncbi:MAG: hypothetical protein KDJ45_09385 [Hyphomicrobiaceae bacterium]|nr:hypothetical protein [Hyphomicrobiaceae bacterium]
MKSSQTSFVGSLLAVFLWPGDFVRRKLGIELEEDGGIVRSFVNMIVWGGVILYLGLKFGY